MNIFATRLETERLILRPTAPEDFEGWAAFMADEESARFVGGVQPRSVAWRGFHTMAGAWAMQGYAMFSVIEKSSGRWIGQTGPWRPEGWPGNEVGWAFHPSAWGKGYATEATVAAVDWTFANLDWSDMIHCIAPANRASQALAQRIGSTLRGPGKLPPPYEDAPTEIWTQTRADWLTRRNGANA